LRSVAFGMLIRSGDAGTLLPAYLARLTTLVAALPAACHFVVATLADTVGLLSDLLLGCRDAKVRLASRVGAWVRRCVGA
jgi:hypothetical protein